MLVCEGKKVELILWSKGLKIVHTYGFIDDFWWSCICPRFFNSNCKSPSLFDFIGIRIFSIRSSNSSSVCSKIVFCTYKPRRTNFVKPNGLTSIKLQPMGVAIDKAICQSVGTFSCALFFFGFSSQCQFQLGWWG